MNEFGVLMLSFAVGLLLGLIFFGGLWLTVRRGTSAKYPIIWFGGSFLLRTAIVLAGFYWIAGDRWEGLLLCVAGFLISRFLLTRFYKTAEEEASLIKKKQT